MEEHLEIERRFFVEQGGEKPWRVLEASSKVIQYYLGIWYFFYHLSKFNILIMVMPGIVGKAFSS